MFGRFGVLFGRFGVMLRRLVVMFRRFGVMFWRRRRGIVAGCAYGTPFVAVCAAGLGGSPLFLGRLPPLLHARTRVEQE